ncbi:helix-turn-helix transcriptional regulator [Candidatus Poriferisocius sp.]|uniref:helix-turn-helix transcriptional regulator n=1 Tax=Candidatus Poriferisocius sp. TaxID=3101276 RepID=UPI003B0252DD
MEQMVHPGQLGQAIRHLRKEKGLTQKNLARMAGVSAPWLSDAENGKPTVEVGLVFRVLRTLGCSLSISDEPVDILSMIPHSGNPDAGG